MSDVVAELIDDWLEKHPIDVPTPLSPKKQRQITTKKPTPTAVTTKAKTKRSREATAQQQNGDSNG